MRTVTLREVTQANFLACVRLEVAPDQSGLVAPNVYSLAQARVNPRLTPLAVYDGRITGHEPGESEPMVGFVMYQIMDGVGFIMRLMIGEAFQRRGYGRAAMLEVIRRLKMTPEIEYIGTSVAKNNPAAEKLYRDLGFVDADKLDEREFYLRLDWQPA